MLRDIRPEFGYRLVDEVLVPARDGVPCDRLSIFGERREVKLALMCAWRFTVFWKAGRLMNSAISRAMASGPPWSETNMGRCAPHQTHREGSALTPTMRRPTIIWVSEETGLRARGSPAGCGRGTGL
jgi:hypothetical protein